jgi:F-type H+-transporting ATPase subunit a
MHGEGIAVVLKAEQIGSVFGFPITNALLTTWLVMLLLIAGAYFFRRSLRLVPGKFQAGVEWALESAFDYATEVLGSEEQARRFFPLIATIFIFIATINLLEFVPGFGSLLIEHGGESVPLLRAATTDLNFTLPLAAIAFLTIEITGIVALGFFSYAQKYVTLSSPVNFAVGLIELVSNLGRLISFSFRLFGNIFAGEVLIAVVTYFLPYGVPAPLMAFELFIGLVQALVFAMLTLFFIKLAIVDPHEAHAS